jgi:asparagine synthase (glutamine-hydrolysing)
MELEYCYGIEVDPVNKCVSFARDYLGFYPLIYSAHKNKLFITDDFSEVVAWSKKQGVNLTISDKSLALYFTMGYVPQGYSLYEEISTCRNASIYKWEGASVICVDMFVPIEEDPSVDLEDLGQAIEQSVVDIYSKSTDVDVWCSGGLDSCIMASLLNSNGRHARLLTMDYSDDIASVYGHGEVPFAELMQASANAKMEKVILSQESYLREYKKFIKGHIGPVIDIVVVPKYLLAEASRSVAITGEGGDPLFSGVKNNKVLFVMENSRETPIGEIYARAHNRFFDQIENFFTSGPDLKAFVIDYMEAMLARYPGDTVRKLFYANTFEKQGGMIFPKNYYAGKYNNVDVFHPLTAYQVYKTAFLLEDSKKYQYPQGKLALINLYKKQLPAQIIDRKKSGTRLPLDHYMDVVPFDVIGKDLLSSTAHFKSSMLSDYASSEKMQSILKDYSIATLANWLTYHH